MRKFVIKALEEASETNPNSGNIEIYSDPAAEIFMQSWFYFDNKPFEGDLSKAFGSYVGIFRKNIEITDISHPEIIVLFRKFSKMYSSGKCNPLFHTQKDVFEILRKSILPENIKIFSNEKGCAEKLCRDYISKRADEFIAFYGSIFKKTIIIDFKTTSFTCHIPRSIIVNLEALVAQSGYIHSLGNKVYVRRAKKASISELKTGLEKLHSVFNCTDPVYITAYSPEFFNSEETRSSESMDNGLDGLKLSGRKHYIEDLPIIAAVPALVEACNISIGSEAFYSPTTDGYSTERKKRQFYNKFTVFLIQDRSLVYSKTDRQLKIGSEVYLICYAQRLKNENPTHIFKESKPGWLEPVTIPHTLSAAHINIASGRLQHKSIIALDPFCGTGTTLLDVAQRYPDAKLIGFDRNPNSIRMSKENFQFFSVAEPQILSLFEYLCEILKGLKTPENTNDSQFNINDIVTHFREIQNDSKMLEELSFSYESKDTESRKQLKINLDRSIAFVLGAIARNADKEYLVDNIESISLSKVNFSTINKFIDGEGPFTQRFDNTASYPEIFEKIQNLNSRFVIYAIWRAIFYASYRFQNDLSQMYDVLLKEFITQTIRYKDFFKYSGAVVEKAGMTTSFDGLFSKYVKPNDDNIKLFAESIQSSIVSDIDQLSLALNNGQRLSLMKVNNSIDTMKELTQLPNEERPNLIITDPPYGFNTDENGPSEIEEMFSKLAGVLFDVVADNGVIAITLPGQSRNGKEIPFYETRTMFVRKLLDYAGTSKRSIVSLASILPDSSSFPRPAFRWNAEKGVSRHSLVFQVK